ncbi:STAS domain-containing protein [Thalassobacter stenotrophicus]|nr:STAS domain-containing protein [Thalassobacter stenotrophicus]PVZ47848.1 STAS domain-containing protein [Thalassobacter stenotrophicus]
MKGTRFEPAYDPIPVQCGVIMASVIALPARVDLSASIDLRDRLLSGSSDVTIDASSVNILTTPGLQVLLAAKPHLAADSRALTIDAPSAEFLSCLTSFGTDLSAIQTEGAAP